MNVQAHMSGQISGQVPNQGGLSQPNGNSLQPMQMHNVGVGGHVHNSFNMDPELLRAREFMRLRIMEVLKQRQNQPINDASFRLRDIAKRLEEGLFKNAHTKEEYTNLGTLESRLQALMALIKSKPVAYQRHPQLVNSSPSIGTMIPTPGMSHSSNQGIVVTSSMDSSFNGTNATVPPTTVNMGSLLPTGSTSADSLSRAEGNQSNGYQQSSTNFSVASGGMSSMPVQRVGSQMIPTPGFSNSSSSSNQLNNQSYLNNQTFNNGVGLSTVESTISSQQQQQKQHGGGQNSRILHTLGSQMGSGIRASLQQKSFAFSNGSLNQLGMVGGNLHNANEPVTSGGYQPASSFGNSPKPLPQHYDQLPRPSMQGDGYGLNSADSFGSGNLYCTVPSSGSMTGTQNSSSVSLQSLPKANSTLRNQLNMHGLQQAGHVKLENVEQFDRMNFQPSVSSKDNLAQSHQPNQFQNYSHQYQQQQQFVQLQHKQQNLQKHDILSSNVCDQSDLASDLGNQAKLKLEDDHHQSLHHQASDQFQLREMQNQFHQTNPEERDISSSLPQNSQQVQQMLLPNQFVPDSRNDFNQSVEVQQEAADKAQQRAQSQDRTQMPGNISHEQHVHEDFHQRISGKDDAQCNSFSSDGPPLGQTVVAPRSAAHPPNSGVSCRLANGSQDRLQFRNQQRWLLFLRHARRCAAPEGKCQEVHCFTVQKLWRHMETCNASQCSYPRCLHTKKLIQHHKNCQDSSCPVCVPVKKYLQAALLRRVRQSSDSGLPGSVGGGCRTFDSGNDISKTALTTSLVSRNSEDQQPTLKRLKIEQPSQCLTSGQEDVLLSGSLDGEPNVSNTQNAQEQGYQKGDVDMPIKPEPLEVKPGSLNVKPGAPLSSGQGSPVIFEMKKDNVSSSFHHRTDEHIAGSEAAGLPKEEGFKREEDIQLKQESVTQPSESTTGTKSGKPKIKGVSMTELFTPEQVREHIRGLRRWVGQSKAKAEKNQAMEHSMSENSCQLCAVEKLTFEPPPIYCTSCGGRIKRNAMFYTMGAGDTRHYLCIPCHNEARGDTIIVEGTAIPKARLEKKKNDEETEEWWVQCDKCEAWQHQICALFNGRRNDGGQAEYTCPNCYMEEIERGERKPLPQSAVLGAKDLPRTILSDHIEQRLFKKLKNERLERARVQGKSYDEVPGAEALVVRVVSSVDKKLEVKQRFLEIFQEENYPSEFSYKSKVVLLFQKIEGVEVCLFGMYVQEFGAECAFPNQRRVYLSYLDSVKYFRPEVKTVTGEALRTYVYHEILIGYLEYCKKRGFTSCYIWACPPLKGEDYILYCHPEIQKTPKSDKLREWYLSMLRKASKENVVVELTNLYDHFFMSNGECKAKVTAARLPYFDGDYWPGAAEDLINQLRQEEDGRKLNKKGTTKKTFTKRALKASGQSDLSANASKDLLLMHKLGETISPMKEDFIMVHLQHCCSHCCILMVSGNRWVCSMCKNFQICDKCYEAEHKREEKDRHPINQREKHVLHPIEITDIPTDTKDRDEILESEFFDTRQAFLSLCQGNHYQYDTLRRAKHSSMMVLYHLHNPTAPAFVTTCNKCHLDIETGHGWRCEVCPDYDVCNSCYQKDGCIDHPHKLTNHPSTAERDAQNKEARQMRVLQLRKMLDLLVHASQCRSPHCQYPNCRKVKGLFRHGIQCKTRASGGCVLCKKMWYILQLHARACKESECHVPRCRDLKEHLRRLQQQSDSRRRAAVMEMMRQRAAEVAGNSG